MAQIPIKAAKNAAKLVGKTVKFGIDTFVKLIDVIVDFVKNIPKHLDTLKGWIDEFIASLQAKVLVIDNVTYSVVDPITALGKLFVDIVRRTAWKKLNGIGVSMLKNEEGLYTFWYNGKKLEDGLTQNQAEEFLKELFAISQDRSDIIIKKYLDDLSVRFGKIKKYNFEFKSLIKKYIGENLENSDDVKNFAKGFIPEGKRWCWPYSVKYCDAIERLKHKVFVKDGKLYNYKDELIDTLDAGTLSYKSQKAIFVMDRDGVVYLSNFYEPKYFHHSSFLGGKPVCAAGEIKVVAGEIKEVNISSGHYEPTYELNKQFVKFFKEKYNIKINLKNEY